MKKNYLAFTRKINFAALVIIFCIVGIPFCKKIPTPQKSKFTVMSNGNDPLLVQARAKDNKTIDIYGVRDDVGKPVAVTDVVISSSKDTIYYKFNQQKKLSAIFTPNGTQFFFNWLSVHVAAVTVLAPDGVTQLSTQMDFSSPPPTAAATFAAPPVVKRPNTPIQVSFTGSKAASPKTSMALAAASKNVLINVTQCESLADGQVYVAAKTTTGSLISNFPAQRVSKGVYSVSIPDNTAPTINPGELCLDISGVLDNACVALENPTFPIYFCAQLTTLVARTGIGALVAAEIAAACGVAMTGLELYCSTLGQSAPGGPSLAEQLCNSPYINRTITQDIILIPYVISLPANSYGFSARYAVNGPVPTLSVNLGSQTAIRKLDLNPPAPVVFQSYVALVDVYCLPAGSQVNISVVGTDGYSNSVLYTIPTTQGDGQFSLTVPGAATAGIHDTVTLTITLPNGNVITRKASLVFV